MNRTLPLVLVLVCGGCGDSGSCDEDPCDGGVDASIADAGSGDAGERDAGATDAGATDAGAQDAATSDAGSSDAGRTDAGSSDAGRTDAGRTDAGGLTCLPSAVRFIPPGGSLRVGQLCDDVFACAVDAAHAAAIASSSSRFVCSPTPEGPCSGITCAYRDPGGPSTLDASEIDEICAVTLVSPTPDMVCMVYL